MPSQERGDPLHPGMEVGRRQEKEGWERKWPVKIVNPD